MVSFEKGVPRVPRKGYIIHPSGNKEMIASRLREQKAVDLGQEMDYKSFPLSS